MRMGEEKNNSLKALEDFAQIVIDCKNDISKIIEKYVFFDNCLTLEAEENGIDSSKYSYLCFIVDLFRHHIADYYTRQQGYTRSQTDFLNRWEKIDK